MFRLFIDFLYSILPSFPTLRHSSNLFVFHCLIYAPLENLSILNANSFHQTAVAECAFPTISLA